MPEDEETSVQSETVLPTIPSSSRIYCKCKQVIRNILCQAAEYFNAEEGSSTGLLLAVCILYRS